MSDGYVVRPARVGDSLAIAEIYNEGIEDGTATFETRLRSRGETAARIADREAIVVADRGGEVIGWAGITPYSERACYASIGVYAVYVARDARGNGVGRALLRGIIEAGRERGLHKLMAKIFVSNGPSLAIARSCGFREVGVHEHHGQLEGQWIDVVLVELLLDGSS
jgi:phosphinothricin acetyltransferase